MAGIKTCGIGGKKSFSTRRYGLYFHMTGGFNFEIKGSFRGIFSESVAPLLFLGGGSPGDNFIGPKGAPLLFSNPGVFVPTGGGCSPSSKRRVCFLSAHAFGEGFNTVMFHNTGGVF